ncbi:MAG: hypothetical protein H7A46_12555 [Verrucomicrobiales bacterium]|nr:hypothetical protein [Verrucomicrobiales bacterium]
MVPYAEPRSYQLVLELYRDPSRHELIGGTAVPVTITTNLTDAAAPLDLGVIPLKSRLSQATPNGVPAQRAASAGEPLNVKPLPGIHGVLTLGGQAWTNQLLGLCRGSETVQKPSFEWSAQTRTDKEGRYHFPGPAQGEWEIWLRTPRLPELPPEIPGRIVPPPVEYPFGRRLARVEVFDRETVETNIHSQGRIITGRAVVANPVRSVDLRASFLTMRFRDSNQLDGLTGAWVSKDGSCMRPPGRLISSCWMPRAG